MPTASMSVAHGLSEEEAIQRLQKGFQNLKESYQSHLKDLSESWNGNTLDFCLTTFGFSIMGTVIVETSIVNLSAKIPLTALPFKGMIEVRVRDEIGKMLL